MSTLESTRDEQQEVIVGVEVKTTKLLWENNKAGSRSNTSSDHSVGASGGEKVENIIEKEVLLARERERQLRQERDERNKQLAQEEEAAGKKDQDDTAGSKPAAAAASHHNHVSPSHGHGTPAAAHTDSLAPSSASSHTTTTNVVHDNNKQQRNTDVTSSDNHVTDSVDGGDMAKTAPTPTVPMTYEQIIAEPRHKGEGLVFDEIQRQKAREDELRRNYGDRGIQLTSYQSSSIITVSSVAAANHSEPAAQHNGNHINQQQQHNGVDKPTSPGHSDDQHVSARKVSTTDESPPPVKAVQANSAPSSSNAPNNKPTPPPAAAAKDQPEVASSGRRQSSVHMNSWLVVTDTTDSAYRYMPIAETPIEREIRLNQERENELRSKTATLNRGESVEQKPAVPIAASSIRRQRQDKTDVSVKDKRRTFEAEGDTNANNSTNSKRDSATWDTRRASEIVIEKELREMHAREEELRLTRISKSD